MSGESDNRPAATDIQTRAADWIFDRYDSENWSAEDQANLNVWLNESLAHRVAYVRLETALHRSSRLAALRRARPEPPRDGVSKTRSIPIMAVAVIALLALVAGVASFILRTPQTQAYATGLGGHKTLTLADGSRVELNTDTHLRVKMDAKERTVWLDRGEAYFRIKHNAANPFVVIAAGYRVRDLGTEFTIRNDSQHFEVALIEGRARFESAGRASMQPSDLTPGDVVVAGADKISLTKNSEHELTDRLAWRQGLLVFKYATLADAAAQFNRYNAKKLVIADAATARLTVMGKFPANDVVRFGQVAKAILGVRVETRDDAIVISR